MKRTNVETVVESSDSVVSVLSATTKLAPQLSADVDDSMIQKGLHTLGKHPLSLNHTFLGLKLNGLGIKGINSIGNFSKLMYVDLSDNHIEDLSVLSQFPTLLQLKVRGNNITECLNFAPVVCNQSNAWPTGHESLGSMLTLADLTSNRIEHIREIQNHPFLECLLLSRNRISVISGLRHLSYLKVLDLSYNFITIIEGLDFLPIEELNLEGNNLTVLDGLQSLPNLSVLNVKKNKVGSLLPLSECICLSYLCVEDNIISSIREVESLVALCWFRVLKMSGNPCCKKPYYRARVLSKLQQLKTLDLSVVSGEEMVRALNLYRLDGGDLEARQGVHTRHFPGEPFIDQFETFEDDEL